MGLGKTFVGSEKMMRLDARVNLLICQKSKINDWKEHFTKFYLRDDPEKIISPRDLTSKIELENFMNHAKYEQDGSAYVGIINYELAWRRKDLLKLKDFTLMLDESSLIQNRTAKQSKFILKLNPANVILLSGTPTSGKYENLWTQIRLLGWEIPVKTYEQQYINWEKLHINGRIIKIPDRKEPYKNVERLKHKMRDYGAVFLKTEECFELPEQTFVEVDVSKSSEYNKFMKNSIVTLKDGTELIGDTNLTKLLYARQLCGQYSADKLQAFRELVESTNDRLVVFYNFTAEKDALKTVCDALQRPTATINGESKDLSVFEENASCVVLVQYQAGAMGLNLQKANKVIYYSLPLRSELFEQSKKRIHRIGQDKPCFYYIMKCSGSVEEQIYKALKLRKDFTDELFRDF